MSDAPAVLLRIKSARERTAVHRMHEARTATHEAREALEAGRQRLEEYRLWRPGRERELYDDIQGKEVSLDDLEELKAKIVGLREREQALIDESIELERAVDAAVRAEDEAHVAWQSAQREVQKVEEMLDDWRAREQREVERQADLELEEFSRPRAAAGTEES